MERSATPSGPAAKKYDTTGPGLLMMKPADTVIEMNLQASQTPASPPSAVSISNPEQPALYVETANMENLVEEVVGDVGQEQPAAEPIDNPAPPATVPPCQELPPTPFVGYPGAIPFPPPFGPPFGYPGAPFYMPPAVPHWIPAPLGQSLPGAMGPFQGVQPLPRSPYAHGMPPQFPAPYWLPGMMTPFKPTGEPFRPYVYRRSLARLKKKHEVAMKAYFNFMKAAVSEQ